MVTVRAVVGDITTTEADAIVVNLFEGVTSPAGGTGAVDQALDGAISNLVTDGEFKGKEGEVIRVHTFGKLPTKRVVVVGLGKQDKFDAHAARSASAAAARFLRRIGAHKAATLAHGAGIGGLTPHAAARATAEGALLGLYQFKAYKSSNGDGPEGELNELIIVEQDASKLDELSAGIASGKLMAESVMVARDLVNEPANIMTPVRMAEVATAIAKECGLGISILGREDMVTHGMGAMLGVAAGSATEPKLIVIEYLGDPEHPDNNVALVGKGITFDTGGISLKQAAGMEDMKGDMSGGASVIGAMRAVGILRPKINVFGVVPAVENMPGGNAQRPGDIVRAMNGKTIEIGNTDAEGRLVLADAIVYVIREKGAKRVVDIATLTGAVVVALGHVTSGVMGTSQGMVDAVLAASKSVGEKMWQLPLFDEYKDQYKSDWADVKNTGVRGAGSITAGLFISEFTEGADWVHLDIAGTNLSDKVHGHLVKGATGIPVLTLTRLVQDLASAE
jgi:leucyl aminopeptidase